MWGNVLAYISCCLVINKSIKITGHLVQQTVKGTLFLFVFLISSWRPKKETVSVIIFQNSLARTVASALYVYLNLKVIFSFNFETLFLGHYDLHAGGFWSL